MNKVLLFLFVSVFVGNVYAAAPDMQSGAGVITGQVMTYEGKPIGGGKAFFMKSEGPPPSATRYWRVPDEGFDIDRNGKFTAVLPEGQYFMGAIRKISGEKVAGDTYAPGPPHDGDIIYISQENGRPKIHTVTKGVTTDLGTVTGAAPVSIDLSSRTGITAIEGTIYDAGGLPLEGAIVVAHTSREMIGKPLYVSYRTGKDGKYQIRLFGGGSYYLRVRDNYRVGPPAAGGIMGVYGGKDPVAISIKTGEILGGFDFRATSFITGGPKRQSR